MKKCLVHYFKWYLREHNFSSSNDQTYSSQKIWTLYKQLYELFGDSFLHQILNLDLIFDKYVELIRQQQNLSSNRLTNNNKPHEQHQQQPFKLKYRLFENVRTEDNKISLVVDIFELDHCRFDREKRIEIKYGRSCELKKPPSKIIKQQSIVDFDIKHKNIILGRKIKWNYQFELNRFSSLNII